MAKTDWQHADIVTHTDLNTLGQEINSNRSAIGNMSSVPTIAKDASGAISELYGSVLAGSAQLPVSLTTGVQVVNATRKSRLKVKGINGRTLVNLLGRAGNCESIAVWGVTNATRALDTSNFVLGSNGLKITNTASNGYASAGVYMKQNSHYLLIAEVKHGSGTYSQVNIAGSILTQTTSDSTKFITTYATGTWASASGGTGVNVRVYGASGSFGYFDAIRVYEITAAEKTYIDGLSIVAAQAYISAKYPYVDDTKHVNGVYIRNSGKNILPPLSEWEFVTPYGAVTGPYSMSVSSVDTTNRISYVRLPVVTGQVYTLQKKPGSTARVIAQKFDTNGQVAANVGGAVSVGQFTADASYSGYVAIRIDNGGEAGTFSIDEVMLSVGTTTQIPFEPQQTSYLYLPDVNLRSNVDGSVADQLYTDGDGKPRAVRRFRELALDGSLTWALSGDHTGNKRVYIPMQGHTPLTDTVTKYDGKILKRETANPLSVADTSFLEVGGYLYISIADADSGWGETTVPTSDDIKAYFAGWRYLERNAAGGVPFYKRWVPVGNTLITTTTTTTNTSTNSIVVASTSGFVIGDSIIVNGFTNTISNISGTTLTLGGTVNVAANDYVYKYTGLLTTVNPFIEESKVTPYRLIYQLAQSVDEPVAYEGEVMVYDGANQIEVGTGIVVREVSPNPKADSLYWYVNDASAGWEQSRLKYRTARFLSIYKNNRSDRGNWIIQASPGAVWVYGVERAKIPLVYYDQTATYNFTYEALDKQQIGIAPTTISAEYAPNIKEDVDDLTRAMVEVKADVSVLRNTKAQKQQPQWIAPTLINGWVNADFMNISGYLKDDFGNVRLRGRIKSGSIGSVVFYLPPGYRPSTDLYPACSSDNGTTLVASRIVVKSNGQVVVDIGSNTQFYLDGITFRAEQ